MPGYKIGQAMYTLLNPLPALSRAEIADKAGVYDKTATDAPSFIMFWRWSTGVESDGFRLDPGQSLELMDLYAKQAAIELEREGIVMIPKKLTEISEEEVLVASIAALKKARAFYFENGGERRIKLQNEAGHDDNRVNALKNTLYLPYFRNEAKTAAIDEEIERLTKQLSMLGKPAKKAS